MSFASESLPFGRLINAGYGSAKCLLKPLLPIILISWIGFILAVALVFGLTMLFPPILTIVGPILFTILAAYFSGVMYVRGYGVLGGHDEMRRDAWLKVNERFKTVAWGAIVISLIFLAFNLLEIAISMIFGENSTAAGVGAIILGLVMLIFYVRLMFWLPAVLLENKGVKESIMRSFCMTKGNWWRCFGAMFCIVGLPYLAMVLVMALLITLQSTVTSILAVILTIFAIYLFTVLSCSGKLVLFNDLQTRCRDKK